MNRRIARGEGSYLYDTTGRRYLDGSAGSAAFSIGHGNPEVNAAIASQLAQVACGYHDPMELRYPTQICTVGQGLVIKATCVK
jgi:4-aminobutyrate aminotransferase-like enzyme